MPKHNFSEAELDSLERTNRVFWSKIDDESDLGMVLIAGAYFEEKLRECIRQYLVESDVAETLLSPRGPLGSFGAMLDCAYCLRITDEQQHKCLRKLARIRNVFAHDLHASFSDNSLQDKVSDFADSYLSDDIRAKMKSSARTTSTRELFLFTAFVVSMDLSHREIDVWMHTGRYGAIIPDHLDAELQRQREK